MSQPTTYDRQSSFTLLGQQNPDEPYTGADLDAEFNAVKVTLDEVLANLALIQRDDGDLANQSVGPDQLASSIDIGINPPSAWAAATAYTQYDTAFDGTSLYRATEDHTSGSDFATDFLAGKWELLADFNVIAVADNSITTAKLVDASVTTPKIATDAVTTTKIVDDAVTTAKILDANVTGVKLATNAVATTKIQDAAVTTDKINDLGVTTAKLNTAAVTLAKMADMATASFLGRTTAATGVPEVLTATQATAMLNAVVGDSGSGGTKGLVPAPSSGDTAARKYLGAAGTFTQPTFGAPDIILEDQKTSGTAGGTFSSGADRTRTLNTEVRDVLAICSIASNKFTLPAGTYYAEWIAPAFAVDNHQSFLYDVTNAAELKRGTSAHSTSSFSGAVPSHGCHTFTLSGSTDLEIRHRCQTLATTSGFGNACSFGTEVYTVVKIWKVA